MIIGITGQTGAGKSTLCKYFEDEWNVQIIDCDKIAHDVIEREEVTQELYKMFGEINTRFLNGGISRRAIAKIIFNGKDKRKEFEDYIFPIIKKDIEDIVERSTRKVIFLDAPTLIESGMDKDCDIIIGVCADKKTRKQRIMQRDGLTATQANTRINAQQDDEFYKQHCDNVFYSDNGVNSLLTQAEEFLLKYIY